MTNEESSFIQWKTFIAQIILTSLLISINKIKQAKNIILNVTKRSEESQIIKRFFLSSKRQNPNQ